MLNGNDLKDEAKSLRLGYTSDKQPGYTREKGDDGFGFFDTDGKKITDEEELKRIKALALPPAWERVWICPKANGHLQATGYDQMGRKQYKYHSKWSLKRNEKKHNRMAEFAEALISIRERVNTDLRQEGFSKEKVVALAVSVLDKTHIRIGNSVYTELYGSFGLTSLRNRHIKISGNKVKISFKGKKGVFQEVILTHARLSHMLKKLKDIPGQELFQYYDADGNKKSLDSEAVNEYLYTCTGKDFTAKDFRTWWGTVMALSEIATISSTTPAESAKKHATLVLQAVAKQLGNTPAVCKKYYVHPRLLSYYEEGKLEKYIERLMNKDEKEKSGLLNAEEALIKEFITTECA